MDAYRGVPIRAASKASNYVKKRCSWTQNDPADNLDFYFHYLEHPR